MSSLWKPFKLIPKTLILHMNVLHPSFQSDSLLSVAFVTYSPLQKPKPFFRLPSRQNAGGIKTRSSR